MFKKSGVNVPHLKLLLSLFVLELTVFTLYRIIFYNYLSVSDSEPGLGIIFKSFISGLRFDVVIICYALALPFVLLSVNHFFNYKIAFINYFVKFFTITVFIYYQFIWAADIPYYKQFGNHLNKQALLWQDEAKFVVGFIFENSSYWGFFVVFFILAFFSFFSFYFIFKIFKKNCQIQHAQKKSIQALQFVCLGALIFLGIRGTTSQKTVIHQGFSIISSNTLINNTGLNPNFTFLKSVLKSSSKNNYTIPQTINSDVAYTRNYLNITNPFELSISREVVAADSSKPYNIVVVIMESMSIAKMGYYGYPNLTPNLDKLNKESVFFSNFFSSGIHTFNGLFSVATGFPSLYAEQSLKRYTKKNFDGLGTLLKKEGYETYFGTTHDAQFDNMEGFFRLNHFDNFISQSSMSSKDVISTLGVPDHILYNEFIKKINEQIVKKPFLGVLMSSTDHGPWIIPQDIPFKPNGKNEQENCTLYADWAIGQFMLEARKQPWYNNTVFIFTGDHGFSLPQTYEMPISYNHVPCIIHQPSLFKADTISAPCYQPDIPATVMGIIGANYYNQTFGINILKDKHPFVVFSADDKIGCVDSMGFYYYKTLSDNQMYLRKYKNLDETNYINTYKAKADSMDKNMIKIFNTAEYLIRKNHFSYE